jgi:hypothetical protein
LRILDSQFNPYMSSQVSAIETLEFLHIPRLI